MWTANQKIPHSQPISVLQRSQENSTNHPRPPIKMVWSDNFFVFIINGIGDDYSGFFRQITGVWGVATYVQLIVSHRHGVHGSAPLDHQLSHASSLLHYWSTAKEQTIFLRINQSLQNFNATRGKKITFLWWPLIIYSECLVINICRLS